MSPKSIYSMHNRNGSPKSKFGRKEAMSRVVFPLFLRVRGMARISAPKPDVQEVETMKKHRRSLWPHF